MYTVAAATTAAQKGFIGGYMASTVIEFLRADEYLWQRVLPVGFVGPHWMEHGHLKLMVRLCQLLCITRKHSYHLWVSAVCPFMINVGLCP